MIIHFSRALAVISLALLAAQTRAAPVPKERKPAVQPLLGKWRATASAHGQAGALKPASGPLWFEFAAEGKAWVVRPNGRDAVEYKIGVDNVENAIDWICPWGTFRGVYEVDGKTLKLGFGNPRPDKAAVGVGSEYHEFTYDP